MNLFHSKHCCCSDSLKQYVDIRLCVSYVYFQVQWNVFYNYSSSPYHLSHDRDKSCDENRNTRSIKYLVMLCVSHPRKENMTNTYHAK